MLTSTEINSGAKIIGEEKMVMLVAKAGFDAFDFSMFEMARYNWSTGSVFESDHPLRSANYLALQENLSKLLLTTVSSAISHTRRFRPIATRLCHT